MERLAYRQRGLRVTVEDEWREGDHPRGQPDNPGQFASAPGGGGGGGGGGRPPRPPRSTRAPHSAAIRQAAREAGTRAPPRGTGPTGEAAKREIRWRLKGVRTLAGLTPGTLARRTGVPLDEVTRVLARLRANGHAVERNGRWTASANAPDAPPPVVVGTGRGASVRAGVVELDARHAPDTDYRRLLSTASRSSTGGPPAGATWRSRALAIAERMDATPAAPAPAPAAPAAVGYARPHRPAQVSQEGEYTRVRNDGDTYGSLRLWEGRWHTAIRSTATNSVVGGAAQFETREQAIAHVQEMIRSNNPYVPGQAPPAPVRPAGPPPVPAMAADPIGRPGHVSPEHRGMINTPASEHADVRRAMGRLFGTEQPDEVAHAFGKGLPPGVTSRTTFRGRRNDVAWRTEFFRNGRAIGYAERDMPARDEVYHSYFRVDGAEQGNGVGTTFLANSIQAYRDGGVIRTVGVSAGLDVGGYMWASSGFRATQSGWNMAKSTVQGRMFRLLQTGEATQAQHDQVMAWVASDDPEKMWDIADHPLGKKLLLGSHWAGKFDVRVNSKSSKRLAAKVARGEARRAGGATRDAGHAGDGMIDEAAALLADEEGPEALAEAREILADMLALDEEIAKAKAREGR